MGEEPLSFDPKIIIEEQMAVWVETLATPPTPEQYDEMLEIITAEVIARESR